jgi:hypothetical protein
VFACVLQVCKFFLDAVEKEVYGWFWTCPNGGDACKYRHALPPGYVYKSKKQREAEAAAAADPDNQLSIEEEIEELVRSVVVSVWAWVATGHSLACGWFPYSGVWWGLQRLKLPQTGLTPVTAETFAKWKADRAARKREEEVKRVEEAKKATGGRGLSACLC